MTYDDLLTRLRRHARRRRAARPSPRGCAQRYEVVLVDEFQDTDPVQWDIMRRAFGAAAHARAHRRPEAGDLRVPRRRRLRLPRRRRERRVARDARRQLAQRPGPHRRLRRAVRAARGSATRASSTATVRGRRRQPGAAADRRAGRGAAAHARRPPRRPGASAARPAATRASSRRREHDRRATSPPTSSALLTSGAAIEIRDARGRRSRREPVRPGHVAVLVRTHRNAAQVRDALDAVGIPAVINGAGSVFGTPAATRVAAPARGDRAPGVGAARARGRADVRSSAGRAERVALRRRRRVGGRPPPPARLGAGAARPRRRVADRADHADRGAAGPRARDAPTASGG